MGTLILSSLRVKGFRLFSDVRVDQLGRVNLIVGRNNTGKSCLLEALRLYAHRGSLAIIWNLLESRDESSRMQSRDGEDASKAVLDIANIFCGRDIDHTAQNSIEIGPVDSTEETLNLRLSWFKSSGGQLSIFESEELAEENASLGLAVSLGKNFQTVHPLTRYFRLGRPWRDLEEHKLIRCTYVGANKPTSYQLNELWDEIALTDLEEDVLEALRIITPDIERITFVSQPNVRRRIPVAKLRDSSVPIPLRSMGDGLTHVLAIVLVLVNARDGLALIDEIENGLHYSIQLDLWRLIFGVARRLNVQVFATSHSWDSIVAFQQAAQEDEGEEGVLIRLEEKRGEIVASVLDERTLGIATREQVEIR